MTINVLRGGGTTVGSLTGPSLGSLVMPAVTLDGAGIDLTGSLGRLKLSTLAGGADVRLGGASTKGLSADLVDVITGPDDPSQMTTPGRIRRLRLTGQSASLHIHAGGDINKASFRGDVADLQLHSSGRLGQLSIKRQRDEAGSLSDSLVAAFDGITSVQIDGGVFGSALLAGA